MRDKHVVVEFQMSLKSSYIVWNRNDHHPKLTVRDKHVVVEFQMSLKSSYMVWNRIISTGKLFDAMYTFVIVTMR